MQIMGPTMNIGAAMAHQQRLQLPILFLQIPEDAHVKISQDESNAHLKVQCDRIFVLRDENALLQNMGMPKTTDEDIIRVFDSEIADYLKTQMMVDVQTHEDDTKPKRVRFGSLDDADYQQYSQQVATPGFQDSKHTPLTKLIPCEPCSEESSEHVQRRVSKLGAFRMEVGQESNQTCATFSQT